MRWSNDEISDKVNVTLWPDSECFWEHRGSRNPILLSSPSLFFFPRPPMTHYCSSQHLTALDFSILPPLACASAHASLVNVTLRRCVHGMQSHYRLIISFVNLISKNKSVICNIHCNLVDKRMQYLSRKVKKMAQVAPALVNFDIWKWCIIIYKTEMSRLSY